MKKNPCLANPLYCGLTVCSYTIYSPKITTPIRAALITDLHSTKYGAKQEILLETIHRQKPDLILMAGDIADHKVPVDGTLLLLEGLKDRYPCFYVSGNHEHWTGEMPVIRKMFTEHGVTVLSGSTARITIDGLLAPHQGFFPRYAGGLYRLGETSLIVSRGLCLNRLLRIYNPPELVMAEIISPSQQPAPD